MRRRALAVVLAVAGCGVMLVADPALARDDDVTVCAATAKTVSDGLKTFVTDMQAVTTRAKNGDLAGAQTAVQNAGAALVALSAKLHTDAAKAETPRLKDTVNKLSAEFKRLGTSLTDLASLAKFDTTKLDSLAESMSRLCGSSVGPSATMPGLPAPSPTRSALPVPSST